MKLPKTIKIGYKTYQVNLMSKDDIIRFGDAKGACHVGNGTIHIDTNFGDEVDQLNTLLHEILHACFSIANLSGECSEEKIVTGLANVLLQVLQDNKIDGINSFEKKVKGKPA